MSELLRGGRISTSRKDVIEFTSSMKSDIKLLKHVVNINRAHIIMLMENGIISLSDGSRILGALMGLEDRLAPRSDIEDIHMLVEEEVIGCVGMDVGGNLNLAKSRNDQVATAIRMALREEILAIADEIMGLQAALLDLAENNIDVIIPGYTHLQPAQPTTFAHYLIAQFDIFGRDLRRLFDAYGRINLSPMGAGALATTSFPISRERVAELLGFDGLVENSIDAVASRDFLLEALAALSVLAVDVSRFAEDLILWASMEFGLIDLPDEFTSTSSIMPQKKNPDVLEVIRARMGLVIGDFVAASTILKGLPSTYNLDFQEATPKLWSGTEVMSSSLRMLAEVIRNVRVRVDFRCKPTLSFLVATELANMLTRIYKVPFRVSHRIVGALVRRLVDEGRSLSETTPDLLAKVSLELLGSPLIVRDEDLRRAISLDGFIESHNVRGGPSRSEVGRMLSARREILNQCRCELASKRERIVDSITTLNSIAESYAAQIFHPATQEDRKV
ncbi:MAG: argininosuccinate lyase [Candidatus Bathyarchaeia archaeon]|nr:argininosuccinate lyase [Candidatus Bathyarchaeota archaeon]